MRRSRLGLIAGVAASLTACARPAAPPHHPPYSVLRAVNDAPAPLPKRIERVTIAPASASKVTFQRLARIPEPGWVMPRAAAFAPDGKSITYLASESGDEVMSLWSFDVETAASRVLVRAADLGGAASDAGRSREEELRRERQRDRSEGVTSYAWAKRAPVMVLPNRGDVFVRDAAGTIRQLTKTPDPEIDPKACASGERIAFVRKGELFSVDVKTGRETQLTTGAADGLTHGLSDYVGQEELDEPSGFFWSPKCDRLVVLEVDERPVDKIPVLGWRGSGSGEDLMMQRYPRAGKKNPVVRAGIVDVATKRITWLRPASPGEHYLGRYTWAPDGSTLFVQAMPRDQKTVSLWRVDPATGAATSIASETSPAWVEWSPIKVLERSGQLVYSSQKTGRRHLELRSQKDGTVVRTLTKGEWDVESIAGVDEAGGRVLFMGNKDGATERHLYAARLDGEGDVVRLTPEPGLHSVKVDDTGRTWVDVHSAQDRPPQAVVRRAMAPAVPLVKPVVDPDVAALEIRPPQIVSLKTADGQPMDGLLLAPRTIVGRHPAIVMVYGGPEAQAVWNSWAPRLFWQHLADRGFVVLQVDNRGSGGRGRAFAQQVHKKLGKLELEDQIAAAQHLASLPYVDASRIGIYGHSYGGFMAALAMLDGKGTFAAAVAGSPVTDWRLYDTGYTERYMETPETNPTGYDAADLAKKAPNLTGKLLLTHAAMDENVHYANTAHLIDALVAAGKRFDLISLPGERHGVRAPSARTYMPERIATFFAENL